MYARTAPPYFLFCGFLGRLEDRDVSPRPETETRHDEERDECASAGVGAGQEVEVLRLCAPKEPRGTTVAEAPRREGGGGDRDSRKSAKPIDCANDRNLSYPLCLHRLQKTFAQQGTMEYVLGWVNDVKLRILRIPG